MYEHTRLTYMQINATYNALAMNAHVRRPCWVTKLPIKQYQSCTTPKIHREPIPTRILATNFTVTAKFGKNDLHSSISTPVVQKDEVLHAKNYCSLAKSEKWDSLSNT